MAQNHSGSGQKSGGKEPFTRAFGEARGHVGELAEQVTDAAQDLYGQARDSASQVADAASKTGKVVGKSASAFENALRYTIENKPYTAVAIGIGLGWLLGRMHRPL